MLLSQATSYQLFRWKFHKYFAVEANTDFDVAWAYDQDGSLTFFSLF